uniref:WD repeat-containing protein 63 n=1 Tax=Knipowitschia caucasica TaxID=637954 RepID=A0AAV2KRL2_KNICA
MPPKKEKGKPGKTDKVPAEADEKPDHPEDIRPMVLTSVTQDLFDCVADEDVTGDSPYKLLPKDDILQDIRNRAAVSDFSPVKKIVLDYPEDELLLVYDRDFIYGQSFYLVLKPEAKEKLLNPPKPPTPEEAIIEISKTPEPKPWVSLGSELEIEEESVKTTRDKLSYKFSRVRRKFGTAYSFSDCNPGDVKDGYQEFPLYEDSRFSIKQLQRDAGMQAVPQCCSSSTQTQWKFKKNMCTQYEDQLLQDEEITKLLQSESLKNFLDSTISMVLQALQQEAIMNVFTEDWIGEDEDVKVIEGLMLYQTFTDKKHLKDKTICCLNWHPTIHGVVAVSTSERSLWKSQTAISFSYILFYSPADPCAPQLLLKCPDDILAFEFSPSDPNIIVGGCVNGQVVLWDISAYVAHLQGIQPDGKKGSFKAFDLDDTKECKPVVRPCAVSDIEKSHKAPITDVHWLPQTFEVTKEGLPMENKYNISVQIVTCSPDGHISFWDIRVATLLTQSTPEKKQKVDPTSPYSAPETFKHLDRTWTPLLRVSLPKTEGSGEYAPFKLCFEDYTCSSKKGKHADEDESPKVTPDYNKLRIPSAKTLRARADINTKFFIGTEDGEVVYTNWRMEKDDSGGLESGKPQRCLSVHHWMVNAIQRSPFFKDIILTVGGWNFAIWKEGFMDRPIFLTACSEQLLTAGCWSPSRPAVFFIGREDGIIQVWNLLEETSAPSQVLDGIISTKINVIKPWSASSKRHFLAVCDDLGVIRVFEIPKALYTPIKNESVSMRKYFELEQTRVEDLMSREEAWANHVGEDKHKTEPDKSEMKDLEENEAEMRKVYESYLDMEKSILKSMGLLKEVEAE